MRAGRSILHDRLANLTTSFLRAHEPDADDPGDVLPYQEVGAHLREDLAASRESKRASVRENGDDGGHSIGGWVVAGSPPRMRGRRAGDDRLERFGGLTPANAGTTWYDGVVVGYR